nr:hypothetical protein [Tanacetum cinerariifolium]
MLHICPRIPGQSFDELPFEEEILEFLREIQAEAYNLDLDHQEKVLSMLDVNNEEPTDVEDVLEVVITAKLIAEVVTTGDEIRSLFEKHYNYNQAFLNEVNKGIKVLKKEVRQEKKLK